jgi:hypothetical protein
MTRHMPGQWCPTRSTAWAPPRVAAPAAFAGVGAGRAGCVHPVRPAWSTRKVAAIGPFPCAPLARRTPAPSAPPAPTPLPHSLCLLVVHVARAPRGGGYRQAAAAVRSPRKAPLLFSYKNPGVIVMDGAYSPRVEADAVLSLLFLAGSPDGPTSPPLPRGRDGGGGGAVGGSAGLPGGTSAAPLALPWRAIRFWGRVGVQARARPRARRRRASRCSPTPCARMIGVSARLRVGGRVCADPGPRAATGAGGSRPSPTKRPRESRSQGPLPPPSAGRSGSGGAPAAPSARALKLQRKKKRENRRAALAAALAAAADVTVRAPPPPPMAPHVHPAFVGPPPGLASPAILRSPPRLQRGYGGFVVGGSGFCTSPPRPTPPTRPAVRAEATPPTPCRTSGDDAATAAATDAGAAAASSASALGALPLNGTPLYLAGHPLTPLSSGVGKPLSMWGPCGATLADEPALGPPQAPTTAPPPPPRPQLQLPPPLPQYLPRVVGPPGTGSGAGAGADVVAPMLLPSPAPPVAVAPAAAAAAVAAAAAPSAPSGSAPSGRASSTTGPVKLYSCHLVGGCPVCAGACAWPA